MQVKQTITSIVALLIALIVGVAAISTDGVYVQAAKASSMKVESFEGKVALKNSKGKAKTLKTGTKLLNGDSLVTKAESKANILLDDTKAAYVEALSEVSVKQSGKDLDLIVDKGSVFFDVSKKLTSKESFEIKTSNMVCGIRGTIGEVKVKINKKKKTVKTYIYLLEGKVKVTYKKTKKKKKTETITAGKKITVSTNVKTGKSSTSVAPVKSTDIKKVVGEQLQEDEKLMERVRAACTNIDWEQTVEDAVAGLNEGIDDDEVAISGTGPKVTGTVEKKNISVTYDCVYFGNYWQKDTNGDGKADKNDSKTPIKWRVLNKDGNIALIVADQILDYQAYNEDSDDITWENSTIRTWLGGEFLNNAFSSSEKTAIIETKMSNKDNQIHGTEGGDSTMDKVFLLSLEDITRTAYGFTNYELGGDDADTVGRIDSLSINDFAKIRKVTDFVKAKDIASGESDSLSISTNYWWLRSPGSNSTDAVIVNYDGDVNGDGDDVGNADNGVVPALYVDLTSAQVKAAGTVVLKAGSYDTIAEATIYNEL